MTASTGKHAVLAIGAATPRMIAALSSAFELHLAWEQRDMAAFLGAQGPRIAGISTWGPEGVPARWMAAMPSLRIVSNYGVGYDAVDVAEAVRRGIVVTHTPGVLDNDTANTAILLMLAVSRRLVRDDRWVRSGDWKRKGPPPLTRSIEGARVGMVGMGRIGQTIARKLSAFGCHVAYHSRNPVPGLHWRHEPDLVALAAASDYLVVIVPGGPATRHLVNRTVIEALGPQGTLVNIARGSVVDEAELVAALCDGRLGAAALDVFESEPDVPAPLLAMDNVVLTPHVGSATEETRRAMGDLTVENLLRYFTDGCVLTPVPECRRLARICPAGPAAGRRP
jgi:lactate dehydrogenase-like 2-hydroxyacid dehydrogenase